MAKGLVFEDEVEAKAAFELGRVSFRCSICGGIHRAGSRPAHECLEKLRQKLPSYGFYSHIFEFGLLSQSDHYRPWRYWGRERELLEYEALERSIYRLTSKIGFIASRRDVEPYMLALPEEFIQKLDERNMLRVHAEVEGTMNSSFKRVFNRILELEHFFKEAKRPNLTLPLIVNFTYGKLSFDGENFMSLKDFFWFRIREAAQSLKKEDEVADFTVSYITMEQAYRKLVPAPDSSYIVQAGYFLHDEAYLAVAHGGLRGDAGYGNIGEYIYQGYYIFHLREYERLEFVEMIFEASPSSEDLISRLVEKAKAA